MRLLLVEDEPSILMMTTEMLQAQGYRVLATSTPGEAIRTAAGHDAVCRNGTQREGCYQCLDIYGIQKAQKIQ